MKCEIAIDIVKDVTTHWLSRVKKLVVGIEGGLIVAFSIALDGDELS
jgi:hypothetical protein